MICVPRVCGVWELESPKAREWASVDYEIVNAEPFFR